MGSFYATYSIISPNIHSYFWPCELFIQWQRLYCCSLKVCKYFSFSPRNWHGPCYVLSRCHICWTHKTGFCSLLCNFNKKGITILPKVFWRCLLLFVLTVNIELKGTLKVAQTWKRHNPLAPPENSTCQSCSSRIYAHITQTFLSGSFYACQSNFFFNLHKWHTTGVKEVPTYSLAKILPQTVAQDKETNGVLI